MTTWHLVAYDVEIMVSDAGDVLKLQVSVAGIACVGFSVGAEARRAFAAMMEMYEINLADIGAARRADRAVLSGSGGGDCKAREVLQGLPVTGPDHRNTYIAAAPEALRPSLVQVRRP